MSREPTSGRVVLDDATGIPYDAVRFGEFLDRLEREKLPSHYMVFPVGDVLPELMREFVVPSYCAKAAWLRERPGTC